MFFFNCIHQVSPQSSLLEGGTSVTIAGTNLGSDRDQVDDISIAGVPCRLSDYVVSFTLDPYDIMLIMPHKVLHFFV